MRKLKFDTDNIGGLQKVCALPVGSYTLVYNYATKTYSLTLGDTTEAVLLEVYADGTYSFGENHGRDEHGDYWQPSVGGQIPRHSADNADLLETLERGQWVVLCYDNNGVLRLAGDDQTPLTFSTEATSGAQTTDMNGTAFTFTGKLGHPSYVVEIAT